ncbi:hypothetical protein [Prochlorococcus marinus]|uniref:hypothetical protein n=1 Tax=Prochlorococcus marinus TaxID=1219 RepID=UPI0012DA6CBF|nr:hypothetical protein [Prochlorococcus marinus]
MLAKMRYGKAFPDQNTGDGAIKPFPKGFQDSPWERGDMNQYKHVPQINLNGSGLKGQGGPKKT